VRKNQPKTDAPKTKPASASSGPAAYNITLNDRKYRVLLDGKTALVNGTSYNVDIAEAAPEHHAQPQAPGGVGQPLATQLPGLVLRIEKPAGSPVKNGDTVLVIESMKMENAIVSPVDGSIAEIHVKQGDRVEAGQVLAMVR